MTRFGRVIGKTRWTMRIRLELAAMPDASCGVAGRMMEADRAPASACPAGCPGCGPATKRPPVIDIPLAVIEARGAGFSAGERVRVEFTRKGTILSAIFGVFLPLLGGIAAFLAFMALSRVIAYFAGLAVCFALGFSLGLVRKRSGFLAGALIFPA
jgi:hypothetical protein